MAKIVVAQPYVPEYRRPFFLGLSRALTEAGHTLEVVTGQATGAQSARGDADNLIGIQRSGQTRDFKFGAHTLRSYLSRGSYSDADALVVELAAGSLDSLTALASRHHAAVGVWGHVKAYVAPDTRSGELIKRWQVRRADAVLAYTQSGADQAVAWGAHRENTVVLNNTVDLAALQDAVTATPRKALGERSRTFAYIGSLDAPKRIDLLADALDRLWSSGDDVHVLVAGSGSDSWRLQQAVDRKQVTPLGRADAGMKARLSAESIALVNPGRVGLIAPESFVLGLPIITTRGAQHAPEAEYLNFGHDSVSVDGTPEALAGIMRKMMREPQIAESLSFNARKQSGEPSLENMVGAFARGVDILLSTRTSRREPKGERRGIS